MRTFVLNRICFVIALFLLNLSILPNFVSPALATNPERFKGVPQASAASGMRLSQNLYLGLAASKLNFSRRAKAAESPSELELYLRQNGSLLLNGSPNFAKSAGLKAADISSRNQLVLYSVDRNLQDYAEKLVNQVSSPHVAIVAMEPSTGRILAMAQKSSQIKNLALHAGFPAASLFKVITATAAMEQSPVVPSSVISFRGGTYTLERWNYKPDYKRDKRSMSVAEALARSCNAVFGRLAFRFLNSNVLQTYAQNFGFNSDLGFDLNLPESQAYIPQDDYELSRTAAGFGKVYISPVHAAALAAAIANQGMLPKPRLVDSVVGVSGDVLYQSQYKAIKRISTPQTAAKLLQMMELTTTLGTSRKEFMWRNKPLLSGVKVAAKTGTLKGENPKGLNNWFIAAAPISNPRIALSVIVVDPNHMSTKASRLGRMLIQKFLKR